jgi:hypothetical protein
MAHGTSVSERAQRLRDLAGSAENLVSLASVVDETLTKARLDLLALSGAARQMATRLEREADLLEVEGAL